jgi:hypothetical protein
MGSRLPRRRIAWLAAGLGAAAIAAALAAIVFSSRGSSVPPPPTTPSPLPARPAPAQVAFGASVNRLFNDGDWTVAQISAEVHSLAATGATEARADALWEASEPDAPSDGHHHYDWLFDDTIAGDLAAVGLRWLPVLDYSAPWARSVVGQDHSPPAHIDDYAAYAGAFAARYGPGGSFWRAHPSLPAEPVTTIEVWNEEDDAASWYPTPSAGAYDAMYQLTREAIDEVDPQARVIVGGLVNPQAFLPAMIAADPALTGHIDGVAIHPYGATPALVVKRVRDARHALDLLHMHSVPLYVTEFGWSVSPAGNPNYASPAQRPALLRDTLNELGHSDCGIAAAMVYTWATPERDLAEPEDWFGISPVGPSSDTVAGDPQATAGFTAGLRAAAAPGPTSSGCSG